jgi:hypothetical protein
MEKIILKKDRERNLIGFFKPLFIEKDKSIVLAKSDDFPNDGEIYMPKGIDNFEYNNLYYVDKEDLINNYKYDDQLTIYKENPSAQNPCKFIIYDNKVKKVLPTDIISIYSNNFSLKTQKLTDYSNIESKVFFLEDNECIYGPFKKTYLELSAFNFASYEDEFVDSVHYADFLELYSEYDGEFISIIKKEDISNFLIKDAEGSLYLTDFKSIIRNKIGEIFLFCDDSELLDWGKKKIATFKPELKEAAESLDSNTLINTNNTDNLKWQRFKELLQNVVDEDKITDIKDILSKKKLLQFDDSALKKENEDLQTRLKDKDDKIIELTTQIENHKFEQPIAHTESNQLDFEEYPFVKEAIKNPEKLEENLKTKEDNNRLLARKELLEEDIAKLKKSETEIKASVQDIIKGFERSASEHTSKLAEAKIYTDLLNGINVDISQASEKENDGIVPVISDVSKSSAREYVQEIRERLKIQGRDLSFNDVANLTITVNQSFLTILAGAPGVGKTSLADKFSKSLGLSEQFGYLEIPCAKGWNSSKDLIGFYNPLIKDFQESKTKLRTALKASSKYKNAPFIVLLDEANLSPMEHYWSDFIKVADFEYDRKIKISDRETIEFGDGFRFLATINHDHTTEMLSNRLLDRSSIIQIEKPININNEDKSSGSNIVYGDIFDFKTVKGLFKDTSKWTTENKTLTNKLDEVIKILESNHSGLIISPRKRNSVTNYLRVATGLLDGTNDYIALDYALSQQVLPLVNMRGENHLESLKSLKELLQKVGMEKSTGLLSRIIERGKEFKHFKYVYY